MSTFLVGAAVVLLCLAISAFIQVVIVRAILGLGRSRKRTQETT
jgi:hypothetical protein